MKKLTEKAYAKINLVLNILGKREDGYHEVDFLMSTVDIYDKITIKEIKTHSKKDIIVVKDSPRLSNKYNIAFKALLLMKRRYNIKTNYKIVIEKNIPVSAGMAGGSTDAACVLRMINKLENLNLSLDELSELGAEIGSDVPFCVYSQLARAEGRGEKITLLEEKIPCTHVLVVNPGVGLSTKKVYAKHVVEDGGVDIDELLKISDHSDFYDRLHNDLEPTAISLECKIKRLMRRLREISGWDKKVMISGSGPTVLLFSDDKEELQRYYDELKGDYDRMYLTKIRN